MLKTASEFQSVHNSFVVGNGVY